MKAKLLLCMMALGILTASALPYRVYDNSQYQMANLRHSISESFVSGDAINMHQHNMVRADEIFHQVDFVLDFDTNGEFASMILFYDKLAERDFNNQDLQMGMLHNGSNILSVPDGTYDIIVWFRAFNPETYEMRHDMYVVREQVTIDQDMQLNIAANEAKNHICFQTLTIDGEPVYTGTYSFDENGNLKPLDNGNTDSFFCQNILFCTDYGSIIIADLSYGGYKTYGNDNDEASADFYINDVSTRFVFYSYRAAVNGNSVYTSDYEVQGASSDVTITNDPNEFRLFKDPFITTSQLGDITHRSFCFCAIQPDKIGPRSISYRVISSIEPLSEGETCKYYLSASYNDSKHFVPLLQPMVSIMMSNDRYQPIMSGMPMTKIGDNIIFCNNGVASHMTNKGPNFSYEPSEELDILGRDVKEHPDWPTHPIFSNSVNKKVGNLANNCFLLVSNPRQYRNIRNITDENGNIISQTNYFMNFEFDYIGRYGEKKIEDRYFSQVEVNIDGESFRSTQGEFSIRLDTPLNGVVDATITNENVLVDGMAGSNKAQLHYIAGAEDENPPTTTMLQFKNINYDVTDYFTNSNEGTIEFSAGDFNYMETPMGYYVYDRNAPESVEVSYSPYGEDNWNELVVEEVPENYWPVMGWFYTGSLAGVTGEGLNGWFDLKIRLTDAAGNWQEQVLSPAFRIDDHAYSSVATITPSNKSDNTIYNLAGQRMRDDLESLPHGIYIVGGKKVVK